MNQVLHAAAETPTNLELRRRLKYWRTRFYQTGDLVGAAQQTGVPSLLIEMISASQRSASVDQAMGFLADYYSSRFSRVLTAVRHGLLPVFVLGVALMVGTLVVALFLPLIELIHSATPPVSW